MAEMELEPKMPSLTCPILIGIHENNNIILDLILEILFLRRAAGTVIHAASILWRMLSLDGTELKPWQE